MLCVTCDAYRFIRYYFQTHLALGVGLVSEQLFAALIGFAGVVVGALLVGIFQLRAIRSTVEADFQKLMIEHRNSILANNLERKKTVVVDRVAKVLEVTDLEVSSGIRFSVIVRAVNEAQLLLDPSRPMDAAVSNALNGIAEAARAVAQEGQPKESLLGHQARLVDATQKLFNSDA